MRSRNPNGRGGLDSNGYVVVTAVGHPNAQKNGRIRRCRLVMSGLLGRPLYPDETVHHRNGIRSDDDARNLELRVGGHGVGQRIEDRVVDAVRVLERYASEMLA